jgi:bifunctional oligoribonuclease and PAP phosphatase NrnA
MNISERDLQTVAKILTDSRRIWLTTHVKSDGDGIGCELALLRALKALGKDARAINDTLVPKSLQFLQESPEELLVYDPARDREFLFSADTAVVLDVGLPYRLGRLEAAFAETAAVKICIDHHLEVDHVFAHVLADHTAGSTGEILFGLLKSAGIPVDARVATPLFAAISVDTGSFSYERCTPETFHAASELVAAGADPYQIHLNLNWQRTLSEVKLEGEVIQNLRLDPSGAIAFSEVTRDMLQRYLIDPMQMPTVVNIPLSLDGVEMALLFVEVEPCTINVSARSKGRVLVDRLAKRFGGGGHPLAAGFTVKSSLTQAKAWTIAAARELLGLPSSLCDTA